MAVESRMRPGETLDGARLSPQRAQDIEEPAQPDAAPALIPLFLSCVPELAEKAVVDGLDGPVGVPLIH